jgi:tetraacyldisaccharide 4'-kinase
MRRVVPWAWEARTPAAGAVRAALAPLGAGVEALAHVRAAAYRRGYLRSYALPRPSVSVGNLTVGGTGKTPMASWMASVFAARGVRPGILLRGYGGDEAAVHREAVPDAIVVENPDRVAGAATAVERGAAVLVLDDGFQRLDVARDLDVVLIAAESLGRPRGTLPAGPWREGRRALTRADLVIVTRKSASSEETQRAARWARTNASPGCPVALGELAVSGFRELWSGDPVSQGAIAGLHVLATAGLADPRTFGAQLALMGAKVELLAWPDHHAYRPADVRQILAGGERADVVVMTAKDAVKLRWLWPREGREPLVAEVEVRWEDGGAMVRQALETMLIRGGESR